jgi:hypothetical protein
MADVSRYFDKAFERKEFAELADSPVDALEGLSASDAEHLQAALNIGTIRDLAKSKYVLRAPAIVNLSK